MTAVRAVVAVAIATTLGLTAACSDSNKATLLPSITPTPSTSSAPAFPKTPEGAVAFARRYFVVSNRAENDGDVAALRDLFGDACGTCERFSQYVLSSYRDGGRIRGAGITVVSAEAAPIANGGITVTVIANQRRGTVESASGRVRRQIPGVKRADLEVALAWRAGRWQVSEITQFETR